MGENNQYTNTKVQPKDFTSGWMIAFILGGTTLTLPFLYLGSEIALNLGMRASLYAFVISTVILVALCAVTTLIGNRSRLSTYMVLQFSFGRHGAKLINTIIGLSLLGWFSVGLELLAIAIRDTALDTFDYHIPLWPIIITTSVFITVTTIYGIRSIERLANFVVPVLVVFLSYVLYKAVNQSVSFDQVWNYVPENPQMSLFDATSALIGSSILIPVLMADLSRFIRNDKQSMIALLGVGVASPVALIFASIPTIVTGEVDIIQIMKSFSLVIPAFFLLFLSTWTTNATNLYSITLTFSTIKTNWGFKKMSLITSVFGTILALFGIANYMFDFLNLLGVFSPSIAAIYIIDFFFIKRQVYNLDEIKMWGPEALISWGVASIVTLLTYLEVFEITHAYFVDSFLISGLLFFVFNIKKIFP